MGCFVGCFGLSSNKKRRNSTRKLLPRDQRICSYEPLNALDPTDFSTNSNLSCEVDEEQKKGKKKTGKRVRFDLNVQTYEPILPTTYENDCSEDGEGTGERSKEPSVFDNTPADLSSSRSVYPSNYRYHNCVDSFEDEDGESDLEDEDYYTDDEENADDEDEEDEVYEDQYVTPLLNPVENLAQWKAVKARPVKVKQVMKENGEAHMDDQAKPLLKEIIVNTSLSNWLASPKSIHGNNSSKKAPIVDIINMENR